MNLDSQKPLIVTIGDLTADLVMPVKMPVTPGQSQQMPFHRVEPGGAGNFLIAGQRLGAQMAAVGALGDDLYGWHVLDVLRDEGINVEAISMEPGTTTTVVAVLFEPDAGKFSYVWYSGNTKAADRGSIMVYNLNNENQAAWYASLFKSKHWQVNKVRGLSKKQVLRITGLYLAASKP